MGFDTGVWGNSKGVQVQNIVLEFNFQCLAFNKFSWAIYMTLQILNHNFVWTVINFLLNFDHGGPLFLGL